MESPENIPPPFWLQSSSSSSSSAAAFDQTNFNHRRRRLNRASSFLLNSSSFLIVSLIVILCLIWIIIPKFLNFTSQLLKFQSVKKSWDSLNLILVIFAIVCGFLSRNSTNDDRNGSSKRAIKSNSSTPRWYEFSDDHRNVHNTVNRLRSSSSYPDLRVHDTSWSTGDGDERWRFLDDTHLNNNRFPISDQIQRPREIHPELERFEIREEVFPQPPVQVPSPPRSPPPRRSPSPTPEKTIKVVKRKPKRTNEAIPKRNEEIDQQKKNVDSEPAEIHRIHLPPLSPPSFYQESERKSGKNEKKRAGGGGTTKELLITSLRRKKKKQRQKSIESFESIINSQRPSSSSVPPPSVPPPPPPPPPPSVFHNLFSTKKGKSKKLGQTVASVPPAKPPPPSVPTPETEDLNQFSKANEIPSEIERMSSLNDEDYNTRNGGASPLHPIPPPPPLPPFKMSDWKFVRYGDFVRINSNSSSSRAGSPEINESEADEPPVISERSTQTGVPMPVNDTAAIPMFCASPDVNSKADNFIARFRADLKLQKMNSMKEKLRKRSNLGRD